ncbi:hypothetical protein [Paludisphaera mucosa]|uniref:Uncharacterized protein n=1 Tax=Paludisphaera mucosa TaxID=3030827 RepID=A0ABT6FJL3_9BACT|nr:hypothetical protein [Paludisphaera mucosa]MDG3007694.1 hypothetical protein [Paludisphaera mucosa]
MIRIHLDDATRDELKALRRSDLPHKVRDRFLSRPEWTRRRSRLEAASRAPNSAGGARQGMPVLAR